MKKEEKNKGKLSKKHIYLPLAILLFAIIVLIINYLVNSYCPAKALTHIVDVNEHTELNGIATLYTNNMNNILTWFGAMITLLALFIAIAGWFVYDTFKKDIISRISKYDDLVQLNDKLESYQKTSEKRYISLTDLTNTAFMSIHRILFMFAQEKEDKNLNEKIEHIRYQFNLYSTDKEQKEGALNYFIYNGTEEDIPLLEYVRENDIDEDIKILAAKVIGIIEIITM